jgi:hypothetical protein
MGGARYLRAMHSAAIGSLSCLQLAPASCYAFKSGYASLRRVRKGLAWRRLQHQTRDRRSGFDSAFECAPDPRSVPTARFRTASTRDGGAAHVSALVPANVLAAPAASIWLPASRIAIRPNATAYACALGQHSTATSTSTRTLFGATRLERSAYGACWLPLT